MKDRITIIPGRLGSRTLTHILASVCVALCLSVVMPACTSKSRKDDRTVAKVADKYLYFSEMSNMFPKGCSKEDSLSLAKLYIDNWIKTRLLLKKAELNLSDEQLDISEEIETYRTSLLIYKYEDQLLQDKLDTTVLDTEIQTYYEEHTVNFLLDEYALKALYLKLPANAPNIWNVKRWYTSGKEKDLQDLTNYCQSYAEKFDYFHDEWVLWSTIEKELPQKEAAAKQMTQYGRVEQVDGGFAYMVLIKEKRAPGDVTPIVFVKDKVKNIIINKRKLKFISELERNIYNDALEKNQFEILKIESKNNP